MMADACTCFFCHARSASASESALQRALGWQCTECDGWNGFSTVADYYSTFNAADHRAHYAAPGYTFTVDAAGKGIGFLEGQMYKHGTVSTANALKDRNNNPMNFTRALTLITSGATLETAGW